MRCLSPIRVYPKLKKGECYDSPDRKIKILVPCGHCPACLQNKANEWAFRLSNEAKRSSSIYFVTLTYSDEYLPSDDKYTGACFNKRDCQLFIKRLRKRCKNKLKYYLSAEYGSKTFRPHYHMILFNFKSKNIQKSIQDCWGLGGTYSVEGNEATIHYTTKYCLKGSLTKKNKMLPFRLQSTKLGANYINDANIKWHKSGLKFYSQIEDGKCVHLPRYYKDKIFTKIEKNENFKKQTRHDNDTIEQEIQEYARHIGLSPLDSLPYYKAYKQAQKQKEYKKYINKLTKRQ